MKSSSLILINSLFLLVFCNLPQLEKKVNNTESRLISELVGMRSINSGNDGEEIPDNGELFTVGGNVSGIPLNETLLLQNNFSEVLSVFINGPFSFSQKVQNQVNFNVTILKNPAGRTCLVQNGMGKIESANFNGIIVICQ